ncbi:hypothetical protein [Pedobacter sp. Leaf170]|uniref:hypothetical protein n=1 Tax=Pedobacter sp. Leaf170 TaxID=2876558 RepID=UPI001E4A9CB8|nr:hypothetical protein [Pedobacter sp. Leaf170]
MVKIQTEQDYKLVIAEIKNLLHNTNPIVTAEEIPEIKTLSMAATEYELIKYDFTKRSLNQAS